MMSNEVRTRLNEYVDGELCGVEIQAVEALLRESEDARREVAFLQRLAAEARGLPRAIVPGAGVWAGIEGKIAVGDSGRWQRRARLAVAAVLLVAASSALTALWLRRDVEVSRIQEVTPMLAAFEASEQTYGQAIEDLSRALAERRLSPETAAVIEVNLRVIDEAIRAAREALAADPENQQSVHAILSMYRRKVDLLQQAVDLPNGG